MIPDPHEYLSFLMGVDAITDADLTTMGITILERHGSTARGLLVPAASLPRYSALVRERLSGQVCKFVGDQAAAGWAPFGVWVSWCRSSRSKRSARSLVVNFHLKGLAAVL